MAFKYTNQNNISLPLAVFLMHDNYAYDDRSNVISATALIKPLRSLALLAKNPDVAKTVDVADFIPLRMGSAIHSACELAWTDHNNLVKALQTYGASEYAIENLKINPENPQETDNNVYVEQRTEKEINDYIITGAYDLILDGEVHDYKSTGTWGFINGSNIDDYIKQGSIYKWLNPEKITSNHVSIHYILTDWSKLGGLRHKQQSHHKEGYPNLKVQTRRYPLWTIEETEVWVADRIERLKILLDTSEDDLPECTDEELWIHEHDTIYKHYKDPNNMKRASSGGGQLKSMNEAIAHQAKLGGEGIIKQFQGPARRCSYCQAEDLCSQAKNLLLEGRRE